VVSTGARLMAHGLVEATGCKTLFVMIPQNETTLSFYEAGLQTAVYGHTFGGRSRTLDHVENVVMEDVLGQMETRKETMWFLGVLNRAIRRAPEAPTARGGGGNSERSRRMRRRFSGVLCRPLLIQKMGPGTVALK